MFARLLWATGGVLTGWGIISATSIFAGVDIPLCFANAGGIAAVLIGDSMRMHMRRQARG